MTRTRDAFTARRWKGNVVIRVYPSAAPGQRRVLDLARLLLGQEVVSVVWASHVRAPDGAEIEVPPWSTDERSAVCIDLCHLWFDGAAFHAVCQDPRRPTLTYNRSLRLRDDAPQRVGSRILAHQVRTAHEQGIAYLPADAKGSPHGTLNGYNTCARLDLKSESPRTVEPCRVGICIRRSM